MTIFRSILDRLIYNDEYKNIDSNLTDPNVEARKGRNIRDNVFVLNAVTNSVVKGNAEPIDIQLYDVEKFFDALWMEECINDIFDAGLDNDKLSLLFLENQNAKVAIKTAKGLSERILSCKDPSGEVYSVPPLWTNWANWLMKMKAYCISTKGQLLFFLFAWLMTYCACRSVLSQ